LFADPHTISDKEVGLHLVASLPSGKTGQLGPYWAAKIALAKSIAAADPAAFNLEGLEDELNSIHKVLYPNMWNDEKEILPLLMSRQWWLLAMVLHKRRPNVPTVANGSEVNAMGRTTSLATWTPTLTSQMVTASAHIVAKSGHLEN